MLEIGSIAPLAGYGWLEGQDETTRTEMNNINVNTQFPHGVDALRGNVTAPAVTTMAEKSALALKAHADRNPGQVQIIEAPRLRTVEARN